MGNGIVDPDGEELTSKAQTDAVGGIGLCLLTIVLMTLLVRAIGLLLP